jgi:hypothetical protein
MQEQCQGNKGQEPGDLCQEEDTIGAGPFAGETTDKVSRAPGAGGENAIEYGEQVYTSFVSGRFDFGLRPPLSARIY